eukprot:UN26051
MEKGHLFNIVIVLGVADPIRKEKIIGNHHQKTITKGVVNVQVEMIKAIDMRENVAKMMILKRWKKKQQSSEQESAFYNIL